MYFSGINIRDKNGSKSNMHEIKIIAQNERKVLIKYAESRRVCKRTSKFGRKNNFDRSKMPKFG